MGARSWGLGWLVLVLAGAGPGSADEKAPESVTVTLKDGGTLVGTIVAEDEAGVTLRTSSGVELKLPREAIASRSETAAQATSDAPQRSPLTDPNESRLMFAPTGRPLGKGNGYFSDHYVLFPGVGYGLTKNLSVGGGLSAIPAVGLTDQLFYLTASSGWKLGANSAVAVGGFLAGAQANEVADFGVAALYGIGTLGPPDRSLSLGIAAVAVQEEEYLYGPRGEYLRTERPWRFRDAPVLMLGGSLRVARNLSLIGESWLLVADDFDLSQQPFGLALRFFNGRLSADVGVILVGETLDEGFPVPWLSFSYHFGPSRSSASRSARAATPAMARTVAQGRR
jgi:hypothetical protein